MGVNRLSMGVQSFDDAELAWLGRIHSADEADAAFHAARAAGFANINLDFIFGLPDQDPATWARTLARAIDLAPEHLSLYSLTVEPGTPLFEQARRGVIAEPDDDLAADLYALACDALAAGGYAQYEISNWARGIRRIRRIRPESTRSQRSLRPIRPFVHSSVATTSSTGATSRTSASARGRTASLRSGGGGTSSRCRSTSAGSQTGGQPEREGEIIDRRLAMGETMMLGLRLVQEGVADARFRARFGVGLEETFGAEIAGLVRRGLLERLPDRVRLTPEGRLLGNQVFAEFLPG